MVMSRRAGLRPGVLAAVVAVVLAGAAVAAAGGVAPSLLSPNHTHVGPGRIRLVVKVPLAAARHEVFVAINSHRRFDRFGHLKFCASVIRCDFVKATPWKGHKFSYVARFNFPGYWAVTPGRYYWQAHYYTADYTAVYYSGVGSFVVK
jgi:hypothetical protein